MAAHDRAAGSGDPGQREDDGKSQSSDPRSIDQRARAHYDALTADERRAAIRDLARRGYGDYEIAAAARASVEWVRATLAGES